MRKNLNEENENGSYRDILEQVFLKQIGITYSIGENMNRIPIYFPKNGFINRIIFGGIGREFEDKAGYWIRKIESLPSIKNREFLYWVVEDNILSPVFVGELNEKIGTFFQIIWEKMGYSKAE